METIKVKEKNLNALVPEKLYKELKIQLLKQDQNYKDWLINQIEEYIEEINNNE